MIQIHILHEFMEGPWGGGNQFLKALRRIWTEQGIYTDRPEQSDAVLFNSYPFRRKDFFNIIATLKTNHPRLACIHRVDGPISKVRGNGKEVDLAIHAFNRLYCDGTVFQSNWSRQQCKQLGLAEAPFETTIVNAPDPAIFYPPSEHRSLSDRKIQLLASSWSGNPRKGFDVYEWLDQNLDPNLVEMTFVGNSPIPFRRIKHVGPLASTGLAEVLREHDIYIQAARNEPCSNALLEALHCRLPAIVSESGANPEILGKGGEVFSKPEEIPALVNRIADNIDIYRDAISLPSIVEVADSYYEFINDLVSACTAMTYTPKCPERNEAEAFFNSLPSEPRPIAPLWRRVAKRIRRLVTK